MFITLIFSCLGIQVKIPPPPHLHRSMKTTKLRILAVISASKHCNLQFETKTYEKGDTTFSEELLKRLREKKARQ